MKKLFILFMLMLTVVVVSCQDQKNDINDQQLQNIAQNSFYKSYLAALRAVQLSVAKGDFDLKGITDVLIKHPDKIICSIPASEFVGIYGGDKYQEQLCKAQDESAKLKANLPDYFKLNRDQLYKVSQLHDAAAGIDWSKTIENATLGRN